MEILKERYSITELSEMLGITDHALRYYEKEFGLVVPKNERGRRYYTTQLANTMYQIKKMRDEGLEIKAIKKILASENAVCEPPPVVTDTDIVAVVSTGSPNVRHNNDALIELKHLLENIAENINNSLSTEINSTKEQISQEIYKSKLELGACVENSIRKLESKMEKHFEKVDESISRWRSKNRSSTVKRIVKKLFG